MMLRLSSALVLASAVYMASAMITAPGCGQRPLAPAGSQLVVGGQEASPNEWPFICSLQSGGWWGKSHICGGTLVKNLNGIYYFVTAAHCVGSNPSSYSIKCAAHNIALNEVHAQDFSISKVQMHEQYNPNNIDNDIAILHLSSQPVENDYLQPACLADETYTAGEMTTVLGWGALTEGGSSPDELQKASKPLISISDCRSKYGYSQITNSMLCAGILNQGGIDACQGDSGGPLVALRNGAWTLVGVVSWGYGCARPTHPGVYADVHYLRSWINGKINA